MIGTIFITVLVVFGVELIGFVFWADVDFKRTQKEYLLMNEIRTMMEENYHLKRKVK